MPRLTFPRFVNTSTIALCVLAFFSTLFLILNNVSFGGELQSGGSAADGGVKAHHIFSALLAAFVARRLKLPALAPPIILFFVVSAIVTLVSSLFFAQNSQSINLIYCYVITAAFCLAGNELGEQRLVTLFRLAYTTALGAILVKNIVVLDEVRASVASGGRVWITTIVGGGVNQEGALIALGATLFLGTRYFYPYLFSAALLNLLYSSRGGILMCAVILLLGLFRSHGSGRKKFAVAALVATAVPVGLYLLSNTSLISIDLILERFTDPSDKGNIGRLSLWEGAADALSENFMGYGAMNAVPIIESLTGESYEEGNLHNIYLQVLVDTGVFGLLSFLAMVAWVFLAFFRKRGGVFSFFLIVYYAFGLIRFRGYDPFAFAVLGAFQSVLLSSAQHGTSDTPLTLSLYVIRPRKGMKRTLEHRSRVTEALVLSRPC